MCCDLKCRNVSTTMTNAVFRLLAVLLLGLVHDTVGKTIEAYVGTSVDLPCTVDTSQCGDLHSVKWYRDTSRIYVYSQSGQISRGEGNATKRMTVEYAPNNTEALLKISTVELQDEASYKCEITYLEVRENCDVVQIIKLETMVIPEPPRILSTMGDANQAITNSTFGPFDEGTIMELVCESTNGKPAPVVKWYNGSKEMSDSYKVLQDPEGLSTGMAKLNIVLSRGDLKARYECRVTSKALKEEPMSAFVTMEVHVRPSAIKLEGQTEVVAGNDVQFICDVFGANPEATVKWFNGTEPINESLIQTAPEAMPTIRTNVTRNRDGTFVTKSELQFKATRFDNGQQFNCLAENSVTTNLNDPSFGEQKQLIVLYPPEITVAPSNISRNESSGVDVFIKCTYDANPMEMSSLFWMKDGKNLTLVSGKHDGGTTRFPHLTIKNVNRRDMGEYTCNSMNAVGASVSKNSAYLNVYYPPSVEVIMEPYTPVKASDRINVTALCNVISGNPPNLLKVRWFLGDELLKELPECNYTTNDLDSSGGMYCNVDPIILSLVTVDQSFAGNYTCQGMNYVDWGNESEPTELIVYYPPSSAKLTYTPSKVIKRGQVELHCAIDNPGRPENLSYVWHRGKHRLSSETGSKLLINPVKLDTRNNFTCKAINEGGESENSTAFINVSAPPTFITSLKYQHVRSEQSNMSLTCRVECSPLCYISWFKGNEQIDTRNNPLYDVKTTVWDANAKTGDFESIESSLIWNVHAWPSHPFAKTTPTANYTCQSSSNGFGNGVSATVAVEVEYPPENLTVSHKEVVVLENTTPKEEVNCSGKGHPYLKYEWRKEGGEEVVSNTHILSFKQVTRADAGRYLCTASNIHGNDSINMTLIVAYAPKCTIDRVEYNNQPALVCIVDAVPPNVNFTWSIKDSNETSDENLTPVQGTPYLILASNVESFRTYQCTARNKAGEGFCEIPITGVAAPWWYSITDSIYILIAIIAGIIVCALIICILIICVCRRRRARNKLPNQSTIPDRGRLGGGTNDGSTDPLTNPDKGFYENLPFHGMQTPPNKPYRPDFSDLVYADVDYHYGPMNYKQASIYALAKKNKKSKPEDQEYDDLL